MNLRNHISILGIFSLMAYGSSTFQFVSFVNSKASDQTTEKDSVAAHKLQMQFTKYSNFYDIKDSIYFNAKKDSSDLQKNLQQIKILNKNIEKANAECEIFETKHQNDSLQKDSIVDFDFYNKIISNNIKKSESLNNSNKLINTSLANYRKHLKSNNDSIAKYIRRIQPEVLKLRNGSKFKIRGVEYLLFMADLDSHIIKTHLYYPKSNKNLYQLEKAVQILEGQKLNPLMVTNAGMFTPRFEPEGLYIEDGGKIYFPLDTGGRISDANFYLKPNGVFFIDSLSIPSIITTEEYLKRMQSSKMHNKCATQSGPMLVIDGAIHNDFVYSSINAKIRSGVGVVNNKKVLFAITLDECNFYNFAAFFKDLANCKDALFLDGAISKMYVKGVNENNINGSFGPMISVSKK